MIKKIGIVLIASLLFIIPLQAKEVILGGNSIGLKLEYEGLLICSTYNVGAYNPTHNDIQKGDTLIEVNQEPVETIADFNIALNKNRNEFVQVTLLRQNKEITRNLEIIEENGKLKTGLLVKDEINGIGTLTYMDPDTMNFASLGHEVLDKDTKQMVRLHQGILYPSSVISIQKAQINRVGEKEAFIEFNHQLGTVISMNQFGVFGKSSHLMNQNRIETASQEEVELGKAMMLTVLEGEKIEEIEISISHKVKQDQPSIKSFEFTITDKEILLKTNGIIQGMSGSPIIQNGKLIGAVTHVSSSNPVNGYGLYIDWMLIQSD